MSGAEANRKPVAREGKPKQDYTQLMRDMGAEDHLDWNPSPDEQTTGLLRDDVEMSPIESKILALVTSCCTRDKPGGRTAWGKTERGKHLIAARIAEYFGLDNAAVSKHVKRLLAWGFIRINEHGVFGLGAVVRGAYKETPEGPKSACPKCGRILGESEKCVVCTNNIPEYVFVAAKRLNEIDFQNWLQGWVSRKERELQRIAESTKAIRQEALADLKTFCQGYAIELKTGEKKEAKQSPKKARKKEAESGPLLSVQATSGALPVQTTAHTVYTVEPDSVQSKNARPFKEERKGKLASDPPEENEHAKTLAFEVRHACRRLPRMEGLALDEATVRNIVAALLQLTTAGDVRHTLEALNKAAFLIWKNHQTEIDQTGNVESYGWGYLVRVVQSEVEKRVGMPDIGGQIKTAAVGKTMTKAQKAGGR